MLTVRKLAVCAMIVLVWGVALADVSVTDYSWLQLPPGAVTASCGNPSGTGGNGNGTPALFRWGERCWIPDGALTGNGTGDYWGALTFDKARNVTSVTTQFWVSEGT